MTLAGVLWIAVAVRNLWALSHHASSPQNSIWLITGAIWALLTGWTIAGYFLIYWDLDSDALYERRVWTKRRIEYPEITAVGPWNNKNPASSFLNIEYGKLGSAFEPRESVIANPADRNAFLSILRKRAQQAEFSV